MAIDGNALDSVLVSKTLEALQSDKLVFGCPVASFIYIRGSEISLRLSEAEDETKIIVPAVSAVS